MYLFVLFLLDVASEGGGRGGLPIRRISSPPTTQLPLLKGGGGPQVENLCACFRNCVAFILPVGVGNNKTNPSRKENGPHGH